MELHALDYDDGSKGKQGRGEEVCDQTFAVEDIFPEDFRDANWRQLCEAIDAIKKEVPVSTSLEQLYRSVEDVCVQGHSEWLYAQLQERCQGHASSVLSSLSEVVQGYQEQMGDTAYSEQMLDQVGGLWDVYCSQLMLIRHIFLYLDRTHLLMKSEHRSVFEMGLRYFKEYMNTEYVQVKKMVLQGIMGAVDAERRGDAVRRDVLKNLVRMFALLGLYEDSLMPLFLERARAFYAEEGNRIILDVSLSEYSNMWRSTVEACVIEPHVAYMLEHGFEKLLDEDRIADLKRMYDVFGRVKAHKALCLAFKNHLKKAGSSIVENDGKDGDMIKNIISLKHRMDKIVSECFDNIIYQDAMKDAFGYFVNLRSNRPAELLAKHMDSILRGGGKSVGSGSKGGRGAEDDVEAALDSSMAIFRFIQGKDAFEAFYKKDLAKRLLFNRSFSIDMEKSAISKLKAECGAHFTSN
eukprot:jgi/Picre1/34945/NNA_002411.t1